MNIYDYLKMDHKKVAHLFTLFEKTKLTDRQKEIVELISQELLVHAHSEQETFYKKLAKHPQTKNLASHGNKEHKEIEEQIQRVSTASTSGKNWENAVLKLKDLVEHHVNEEEDKIFKEAKKIISEKEANELKERMHYLKGKLLLNLYDNQRERAIDELKADFKKEKNITPPASQQRPRTNL